MTATAPEYFALYREVSGGPPGDGNPDGIHRKNYDDTLSDGQIEAKTDSATRFDEDETFAIEPRVGWGDGAAAATRARPFGSMPSSVGVTDVFLDLG